MNIPHAILIKGTTNGIIVEIGCQMLVFEDHNQATFMEDLDKYLSNPENYKILATKYGIDLERAELAPANQPSRPVRTEADAQEQDPSR